jgi:RNA polymerase sigma-70 factor (ECF subfamily)
VVSSPSDEELPERLRSGDEGSSLTLFRRYERIGFSVGYRVLQDEGEAEDLAQDMFLRIRAEAGKYDCAKGSARIWIIQMIYRHAFDRRAYLRRRCF